MTTEELNKLLIKAVECSRALDLPYREGLVVLESHGFLSNEEKASEFVRGTQNDALNAVSKS